MVFKRAALAGITALAFGQFAVANESAQQQSQGGMQNEQSARQGQGQDRETIRQAQQALSEKGHQVQADGVLGPKTQEALKEFQKSEGIEQSGRLDQETLSALGVDEASAGTGGSSPSSERPAQPKS